MDLNRCDCCLGGLDILHSTIPIQLPNEKIIYLQLCLSCLPHAFKIILEELLNSEELLAQNFEVITREQILKNILEGLRSKAQDD